MQSVSAVTLSVVTDVPLRLVEIRDLVRREGTWPNASTSSVLAALRYHAEWDRLFIQEVNGVNHYATFTRNR